MNDDGAQTPRETNAWPALFNKLWATGLLSAEDMGEVASLPWARKTIPAYAPLNCGEDFCILLKGIACRQRTGTDRKRRMSFFILPGDTCSYTCITHAGSLFEPTALNPCTVMFVPYDAAIAAWERRPSLLAALLLNHAWDNATVEQLLELVGYRSALERLAHFSCELEFRLARMGLSRSATFGLALTQAEIGDYLALSAVHVNRTLQELRRRKPIRMQDAKVSLLDPAQLRDISGFSPEYLGGSREK